MGGGLISLHLPAPTINDTYSSCSASALLCLLYCFFMLYMLEQVFAVVTTIAGERFNFGRLLLEINVFCSREIDQH